MIDQAAGLTRASPTSESHFLPIDDNRPVGVVMYQLFSDIPLSNATDSAKVPDPRRKAKNGDAPD
jgi:hypothetical protein